jgi:hypothetical protein
MRVHDAENAAGDGEKEVDESPFQHHILALSDASAH